MPHTSGQSPLDIIYPIGLDFTFFANVERIVKLKNNSTWTRRLKISLDVNNLLNSYRHVSLPDGRTPPDYTHDEEDPIGRTIRATVRKQF